MTEQTTAVRCCETCLYMATHEKCDKCLSTDEDWATYRETKVMPEYRYANYEEGNWFDRVIQFELEGKRNIVIGGQGEAETNTQWTPQRTADNLHHAADQCGYCCGSLHRGPDVDTLVISTHEGTFRLTWDKGGHLAHIVTLNSYTGEVDPEGWNWKNYNPFRVTEPPK